MKMLAGVGNGGGKRGCANARGNASVWARGAWAPATTEKAREAEVHLQTEISKLRSDH